MPRRSPPTLMHRPPTSKATPSKNNSPDRNAFFINDLHPPPKPAVRDGAGHSAYPPRRPCKKRIHAPRAHPKQVLRPISPTPPPPKEKNSRPATPPQHDQNIRNASNSKLAHIVFNHSSFPHSDLDSSFVIRISSFVYSSPISCFSWLIPAVVSVRPLCLCDSVVEVAVITVPPLRGSSSCASCASCASVLRVLRVFRRRPSSYWSRITVPRASCQHHRRPLASRV